MQENSESLNAQAIDLASQGDYPEAIACFKKAIILDKDNYLLWYNLRDTYEQLGNTAGVEECRNKMKDLPAEGGNYYA